MAGKLENILFDLDGTLVDSNDAHAHAWVEAMAEEGYHVPFDKIRPLIGMGGDKVLPTTIGQAKDSQPGKRISALRKEIFMTQYLPHLQAFPRAWELLQHMRDQGLTLALASSAEPDELQSMLKVIDPHASDLFQEKTTAKDAISSKPDPDVVQAALRRLEAKPETVIMIGDTAYDIEAATQSGLQTIAFRCGGWSDRDLQGALAIYDGPTDLLTHYEASPLTQTSKRISSHT